MKVDVTSILTSTWNTESLVESELSVDPVAAIPILPIIHENITNNLHIARSCRFNYGVNSRSGGGGGGSNSMKLVFIGYRDELMVHNASWQLYVVDVHISSTGQFDVRLADTRLVVDTIDQPQKTTENGQKTSENGHNFDFPGLYVDQLPRRCFSTNSKICTHTMWGSQCVIVSIDLDGDVDVDVGGCNRVVELGVTSRIKEH